MTGQPPLEAEYPPAALEPRVHRELEAARHRGFRGGFISTHRALLFSRFGPGKLRRAAVLTVLALGSWFVALPWVSKFWGATLLFWAEVLGLLGATNLPEQYELGAVLRFEAPYLYVLAGPPTLQLWDLGVLLCLALAAVSLLLPRRYLPLIYFLRVVALVQACSQVFFAVWPDRFPYSAGGYIHTMLVASLFFIALVPVALAFTYYLFDFTFGQKIALTLIMMGHLTVMIPLQYVAHAFVLYHLSLLFMPLLFFLFGLLPNVFVFIALYGWSLSWQHHLHDRPLQWRELS